MLRTAAALAIALSLSSGPAWSAPPSTASTRSECFLSSNWHGWKPSADSKSIYIRVDVNRIFRLDLAAACPMLQSPGVHLVNKMRGSAWICHPLDLDLKVSDGHGMRTPCFVSGMARLTPEQAAALPKNLRP